MSEINAINQKADAILSQLEKDIKKKKNTMLISLIGGIVMLGIVFAYFGFIKGLLKEVIEPKSIMITASGYIIKSLPDVSLQIEKDLKDKAPEVTKYAKDQIMLAIPEARIYLETQFIMKTEEALDAFIGEFDKIVTEALTDNREIITGYMKDLGNNKKKKEMVDALYQSLKSEFSKPDIKADLDSYTRVIVRLDKKIKYLFESDNLTEEEVIIRDIIFALKELASRGKKKKVG
jgi:hypothetical protein